MSPGRQVRGQFGSDLGGTGVVTLPEVLYRPAALCSNKIPALHRLKRMHQKQAQFCTQSIKIGLKINFKKKFSSWCLNGQFL
ncbi:MAG: hypothetical protein K9I02_07770 [Haliscomenobacter sp.]|nr:hypothetical protein [Haliscomenobacter sp.]